MPRLLVAGVLMLGLGTALASPVDAECNPEGVLSSLEETVASTKRIVIGDVIAVQPGGSWGPAVDGRSGRFTLGVQTVLRGLVPPVMSVDDLITRPCAGPVIVTPGDRIVLMLDADEPVFPGVTFNTVAWITGQPPIGWAFERVTQEQVAALAGSGPQAAVTQGEASWPTGAALAVGASVLVAAAVLLVRRRRPAVAR